MKKTLLIVLCIAVLTACFCAFIACEDKEEEAVITGYSVETKSYSIGDAYSQSDAKITATLSDKSTIDVKSNIVFDGDDKDTLFLDEDGKFTKAGEYKVTVYKFEKREDLKIGEWTIKVA